MEKFKEIPKEVTYSQELEAVLGVGLVINQLECAFDDFLVERKIGQKDEMSTLESIKIFLHKRKDVVGDICNGSVLSQHDCLTLSILTCLLAGKKGFQTEIGRPDKLSRYFHALIIRKNGEIFKVAGSKKNYKAKLMNIDEIIHRIKYIRPIVKAADSIKMKCRK